MPRNDAPQTTEKKPSRVKGHALTMEWSGEYGAESSSTGYCKCGGWEESASNQREVRFEYRQHLRKLKETNPESSS